MSSYNVYSSPYGEMGISASEVGITSLWFGSTMGEIGERRETPLIAEANQQLAAYFAGECKELTLPLDPIGTVFQRRVWQTLLTIPYGQVATYGEIAKLVGSPRGARAVGLANNRNPLPIFYPCHRVVGATGKLVGYAYGLEMKEQLLAMEKANAVER